VAKSSHRKRHNKDKLKVRSKISLDRSISCVLSLPQNARISKVLQVPEISHISNTSQPSPRVFPLHSTIFPIQRGLDLWTCGPPPEVCASMRLLARTCIEWHPPRSNRSCRSIHTVCTVPQATYQFSGDLTVHHSRSTISHRKEISNRSFPALLSIFFSFDYNKLLWLHPPPRHPPVSSEIQ